MGKFKDVLASVKSDPRYFWVGKEVQDETFSKEGKELTGWHVPVIERDGKKGDRKKISIVVKNAATEFEEAILIGSNDGGEISSGNLFEMHKQGVFELLKKSKGVAQRDIEINIESGYGDFKVLVPSLQPTGDKPGKAEYKYFTVVSKKNEDGNFEYKVYEIPNLPVKTRDVRKK